MSPLKHDLTGSRYWKSLDELVRTPEFEEAVRREFPDDHWDTLPAASRRSFLKVMGASMAFAGLTACRWPAEEIVPFAHRDANRVPGVPQFFATAFEMAGSSVGALVTSLDGRPVKAEGNSLHPDSQGALSATAQALILELYDPDRSRGPVYRHGGQSYAKTWTDFQNEIATLAAAPGRGVAVLAPRSSSPSIHRMRRAFEAANPEARWFEWTAIDDDRERAGTQMAFGTPLRVNPVLAGARVVAAFDADFLHEHPAALRLTRELTAGRSPESESMNRLWAAEPTVSRTGAMADHRIPVPAVRVAAVLAAVTAALRDDHDIELPREARAFAVADSLQTLTDQERTWVQGLAADLASNRGAGAVLAGRRQPPEVHATVAVLNRVLGNDPAHIAYVDPEMPESAGIGDLVEALRAGDVATLIMLGGNPVYDAPADLDFEQALAFVEHPIHLSLYENETTRACEWHLPEAHVLESWGDGRAWDGSWTMVQPLIAPLFDGKTAIEVLAMLSGLDRKGYDIVRETFADSQTATGDGVEAAWKRALHDGVVAASAFDVLEPSFSEQGLARGAALWSEAVARKGPTTSKPELVFSVDPKLFDGRFANNGWLQELPESLTTITWDNALLMSPHTARGLGVEDGDLVRLASNDIEETIELPVYVMPGPAANSMTAWLGYGRTAAGRVGDGVGANLYRLRTSADLWTSEGVSVTGTGRTYRLATTQNHWAIDLIGFEARQMRVGQLVREASIDRYLEDPEVFRHQDHHPPLLSLWKEKVYQGEQWGMAIDLNTCTGCSACVVACQAENNIPVVGREQVLNQREMHWIRVDRYFKTPEGADVDDIDDASIAFQPMTCVQCEMAPCEQVCPVAATQHTEDGLNAMVYNRCVGTRYCANNCPFKVRRFNFFNYNKSIDDLEKLHLNPEVTVRSRGVMEKCSFCIQRIQKVRIAAGNENRPIEDGEIVPACAQTCPARAIHFGNLNDPESRVSALRQDPRSYATLAELNIKPRVHYMARLRNPAGESSTETPEGGGHGHDESHGKESA